MFASAKDFKKFAFKQLTNTIKKMLQNRRATKYRSQYFQP